MPINLSRGAAAVLIFALSAPLPAGGSFYLSSAPDAVAPVTVDDELAALKRKMQQAPPKKQCRISTACRTCSLK